MKTLVILLILATPLAAEIIETPLPMDGAEPMTGAEFESFVLGKTFDFSINGQVYGSEEYLPNRRVRWAFAGEDCMNGFWYERAPREICFIYDGSIDEQCWHYAQTPTGIIAQFLNELDNPDIYGANTSATGLFCPGPDVGV